MTDIERIADDISAAVKAHVSRAAMEFRSRVEALEAALKALPPVRDGKDGINGKDGAPGERGEKGADGAPGTAGFNGAPGERGEKGEPGRDGRDAVVDEAALDAQVRGIITAAVAALGLKDGAPGERGPEGPAGPQGGPGERGEKGEPGTDGAKGQAGAVGAPGDRGEKGEAGFDGLPGENGKDGKDGKDGRDGKEGPPGRDALQVDVTTMDASRAYQRGVFATFRGGLLRSVRTTDPVEDGQPETCGWQVVVNGIADIAVAPDDDGRGFTFNVKMTDGRTQQARVDVPSMVYRGVYRAGAEYKRGDVVTWDGSAWHCNADRTTADPAAGKGADWQLCVKKGRDRGNV